MRISIVRRRAAVNRFRFEEMSSLLFRAGWPLRQNGSHARKALLLSARFIERYAQSADRSIEHIECI